jgi:hypothetical protein
MEHAKQANGSGHELSIGHSPSSARKKAVRKKAESPRPLRKEAGSKSKSRKLGCRYCGSNDLAPSFIKRRDRRCRKCFSKRYGSAARARKAKVKRLVRTRLRMSGRARKGSALSFKAWSNFEWGDPAALMNRYSVSNCSAKAINSTLSTGTNVARRRNRSANHETSSETDASMP